jgi:SAM-dependent methyltransferase
MKRLPEPELMDQPDQARAYADADFSEPNALFVDLFAAAFPDFAQGLVADLGCGPADIPVRLVDRYPRARVIAVDGAAEMLKLAAEAAARADRRRQIETLHWRIGAEPVPQRLRGAAAGIVSNSLLHHMSDAGALWRAVRDCAAPGAAVLVMDLLRPDSPEYAQSLVDLHAAGAPEILRRDFHNSLLAAYRPDEVDTQLRQMELAGLKVEQVSDRHWACWGRI